MLKPRYCLLNSDPTFNLGRSIANNIVALVYIFLRNPSECDMCHEMKYMYAILLFMLILKPLAVLVIRLFLRICDGYFDKSRSNVFSADRDTTANVDTEFSSDDAGLDLLKKFVDFRHEMSVVVLLWHDCQLRINNYNEEQVGQNPQSVKAHAWPGPTVCRSPQLAVFYKHCILYSARISDMYLLL